MDGKLIPWLPAATAVAGIAAFAVTIFVYFKAYSEGLSGGYVPFIAGALSFAAVVGAATYVAAPHRKRVRHLMAAILISAAAFGIILLFTLLKLLGT